MMLRFFKNQEGSTTLTIVVSLVLVVALLGITMQWYWVSSSSADVQMMADLGAMAEQEAIGRAVLLMQIIDVTILTANMLGILLHGIVVVAGIATAIEVPIGGGVGSGFLADAIDIDRRYVKRRRDFVNQLFAAADKINQVTPYLAFGYSNMLVAENNSLRKNFNKTQYGVIPVPFPAQGRVMRKSSFGDDSETLDTVVEKSKVNEDSAQNILSLQEELEEKKLACFKADAYKPIGATYANWEVQDAVVDFKTEFQKRLENAKSCSNSLTPIEENSVNAQERIDVSYEKDEVSVSDLTRDSYTQAFGPNTRPLACKEVVLDEVYKSLYESMYFLLEHSEGERKAYHNDKNCSGLLNAREQLNQVPLSLVADQDEHPPCSICTPFHWQVIVHFKTAFNSFEANWNSEAQLLQDYENAAEQLERAQQKIQKDSQNAFDGLIGVASQMIASDRLAYQPPGSRGVVCLAFSQETRKAPAFTLPSFTQTDEAELGISVGLSAARLKPVKNNNVSTIIESQQKDYRPKNLKFGSTVFGFLDMDSGFFGQLSALWSGSTQLFLKGSSGLESMFDTLPWGVGTIAHNFVLRLEKVAGVGAPDLATYRPFLVNTSNVGDKNASGFEGSFVNNLASSKKALSQESKIAQSQMVELAEFALQQLPTDSDASLTAMIQYRVFDQSFFIPFWQGLTYTSSKAIQWSKLHAASLLGGQ